MLENMVVGRPPGNYDRLLDFSRAVTGDLFFSALGRSARSVGDRDPQDTDSSQPDPAPATRTQRRLAEHWLPERKPQQ